MKILLSLFEVQCMPAEVKFMLLACSHVPGPGWYVREQTDRSWSCERADLDSARGSHPF